MAPKIVATSQPIGPRDGLRLAGLRLAAGFLPGVVLKWRLSATSGLGFLLLLMLCSLTFVPVFSNHSVS